MNFHQVSQSFRNGSFVWQILLRRNLNMFFNKAKSWLHTWRKP